MMNVYGSSDNKFPQWSFQETQDFLGIRAGLDPTFMETKRNKLLWELISAWMKEKGYNRSAEQCKCKWKNLVTRYKGCETMEAEGLRQQFPFYNDLQAIFDARMQIMVSQEAEGSSSRKKATGANQFSSDEEEEEEEDKNEDMMMSDLEVCPKRKMRKMKRNNSGNMTMIMIRELMDDFMKQQMQIEMEWLKAHEKREEERKAKEMEWRQTMEALENERMAMDRRWREREEERKARGEKKAEERDALITTLLNKLKREDHNNM